MGFCLVFRFLVFFGLFCFGLAFVCFVFVCLFCLFVCFVFWDVFWAAYFILLFVNVALSLQCLESEKILETEMIVQANQSASLYSGRMLILK